MSEDINSTSIINNGNAIFLISVDINRVVIHSSTLCLSQICTHTLAEIEFTLNCSVQANLPDPNADTSLIEWLFNTTIPSLPPGITVTNTMTSGGTYSTYTSTLQFPPLQFSYAGEYTCRVRGNAGRTASIDVTVNGTICI